MPRSGAILDRGLAGDVTDARIEPSHAVTIFVTDRETEIQTSRGVPAEDRETRRRIAKNQWRDACSILIMPNTEIKERTLVVVTQADGAYEGLAYASLALAIRDNDPHQRGDVTERPQPDMWETWRCA